MVEAQLGDKLTQIAAAQAQNLADARLSETKMPAKGMLAGTKTTTPKINPKTESWVRFPATRFALSKRVEGWVMFPSTIAPSPVTAEWVHYPSNPNQEL
jgi:hypothetical protein